MNHNLPKNGHAPGCLRDAFEELIFVDNGLTDDEIYGERRNLRWLCGKLWNCTDIMPGGICDDLDLPCGSTYAQAARKVIAEDDRVKLTRVLE